MTKRTKSVGVWLCLLAVVVIPACGGAVSKDNYEKVKPGMTMDEVEDILGPGTKTADNVFEGRDLDTYGLGEVYVWEDGDKSITLVFKDGKVKGATCKGLYAPGERRGDGL